MNLKKILVGAMIATMAVSTLVEARPAGGGKSIGRQSQNVNRMPAQQPPQQAPRQAQPNQAPNTPPAAAPKPSPWKGILGGALLGLGLGALFSHFGLGGALGGAIGSILMIALLAGVVYFIIRMIRNRSQSTQQRPAAFAGNGNSNGNQNVYPIPAQQPQQPQQSGSATPEIGSRLQPEAAAPAQQAQTYTQWGVPGDFDQASFLRVAKSNFIRLQAAWDKGDVADIREFTTPEVFAEMRMQISERTQADYTDVVSIDAELLGIETTDTEYLASVKFTGMIKPAKDALAEPYHEVWNLVKPVSGSSGWLLGGIQQLA